MRTRSGWITVLVGLALPAIAVAEPLASDWVGVDESQARLVSAVTGVGQLETVTLGLEIKLAPGFKTYWRAGGSGGPPPNIEFEGSGNLSQATVRWPAPDWYEVYGFDTVGYEDHVVFPIDVRPAEPGKPIAIRAAIQWAACADICIPIFENVSLAVPEGPAVVSDNAELIDRFLRQVPGDGAADGLSIESTTLSGPPDEPVLSVTLAASGDPLIVPDMFVEGPQDILFSRPRVRLVADGWRAVFRFRAEDAWGEQRPLDLTSEALKLTFVDGDRVMEDEVRLRR